MESSSENKSKNTSNSLSESMQKTASKIKTESKVIISTESESSFEENTSSEIQNPNEEIPITYVYSKLQRQYEIFTQLAEAHNIVMVPEHVPDPKDINSSWIRKHDWIIAKVLLDDSHREILNSISSEVESSTDALVALTGINETNLTSTITHLGTLASNASGVSLSNIDLISESQKRYTESVKELIERQKEKMILEYKKCRLAQHIRDNILHYCRAIWDQEDPEQRILRYRKINHKIPTNYTFVGTVGDTANDWDIDILLENIANCSPEPTPGSTGTTPGTIIELDGWFQSVPGSEEIELADLLKPWGPIGYVGNYAMFNMRPDVITEDMFTMLQILKTPYLYYKDANPENAVLVDPTLKRYIKNFEGKPKNEDEKKEMVQYLSELKVKYLKAKIADEIPQVEVDEISKLDAEVELKAKIAEEKANAETDPTKKAEAVEKADEARKTADAVKVVLDAAIAKVKAVTNFFADKNDDGSDLSDDENHFKPNSKSNLTGIPYYAEYKFRKDTSRRFLVDTNNLVLDIMPGDGSVLENFKLAHRAIDVSKAVTENEKIRLENKRRSKLIEQGNYEDPDIEKKIIVAGTNVTTVSVDSEP